MWKSHFSAINKLLLICRHSHSLYTLYTAAFTKLPTKNWHLPFASMRMKSLSHCGHWPSSTLKGVQGGDQAWGTLCLVSIKLLKSLIVTSVPFDWQQSSTKICNWLHVPSSITSNIILTDLPPCLFGAVSQGYLRGCLQGCSPHSAPNKC